ncbi:hypothetical protein [Endozoicomonas atrinae]|uniref:hypothetical protein n=1 Tax=Endozoicomonas atrinae TaxID=1333660 RepID=UPI001112D56A|nr:hypothetical protein [Endozoicomonas atrinae]
MNALGNKYIPLKPLPTGHQAQPLNPLAKPFIPDSSCHTRESRNISSYDIHSSSSSSVLKPKDDKDTELPTLPQSASTRRDAQSVYKLYRFVCNNLHHLPKGISMYGSNLSAKAIIMEERSDLGKLCKKLQAENRMTEDAESYRVYEMLNLVETYLNPIVKKKFTI